MTCPLKDEEVFVLKVLAKNRCFSRDKGFHHEKLENLYYRKFPRGQEYLNFDDCIQQLLNKGYIARIKKKKYKYYIAKASDVLIILGECGVSVPKGGIYRL